jgi:Uncharacterized conserved protein
MGKIITCSLSGMKSYDADIKYFIVQRPGNVKVSGMIQRPDLAPNQDLFFWTQKNKHKENWFDEYTERFCYDMKNRTDLKAAIDALEVAAKDTVIMLVCFCSNVDMCHRGLIANELISRGITVERY